MYGAGCMYVGWGVLQAWCPLTFFFQITITRSIEVSAKTWWVVVGESLPTLLNLRAFHECLVANLHNLCKILKI